MRVNAGLLLGLALLLPVPAIAAEDPNLDYLVFDAVPLNITTRIDTDKNKTTDPATPPYQASEAFTLPNADKLPLREAAEQAAANLWSAGNKGSVAEDVPLLEARLKQQETGGDAFNLQLTETLSQLAAAYEKQGDFAKSLAIYERANHLIRVNHGLYSLDQEPVIKRMIGDHLARGDVAAADDAQSYLFYLRSKIHGRESLAMVPALQELAQWKITAYRMEAVMTPAPPAEGAAARPRKPGSKGTYYDQIINRLDHLKAATEIHDSIVKMLRKNASGSYLQLSNSEQQLAVSNFLYTRFIGSVNPMMNDPGGEATFYTGMEEYHSNFSDGRKALERRVKLLADAKDASALDVARARLDLTDWLIATSGRSDLRELFESAYRNLASSGIDAGEVGKLFSPPLPIQLPTFVIYPYTRASLGIAADIALDYRGYIDLELDIAATGESSTPKVLYRSPGTPPRVVDTLIRSLRRAQFRPHIVDGKMAGYEDITVRYYYAY